MAYLRAKAERQSQRNKSKLTKLKDFQSFNQAINKPDTELDTIIGELQGFDDYFFNRKIYSILHHRHGEYFAISRKGHLGLVMEESLGRKFYQYVPVTL